MESLLPESIQAALLVLVAVAFLLDRLAKARPEVRWLSHFRWRARSSAERAQARRRSAVVTGVEFILCGILIPMGYAIVKLMLFTEFETLPTALVLAVSAALVGVGVVVIARSGRGGS